jgi:hypothetical protein
LNLARIDEFRYVGRGASGHEPGGERQPRTALETPRLCIGGVSDAWYTGRMAWGLWTQRRLVSASEVFRRQHSLWLTRALLSGREYPRIPVRAVARGGWSRLMARPGGPALAERWWAGALARVDDVDTEE